MWSIAHGILNVSEVEAEAVLPYNNTAALLGQVLPASPATTSALVVRAAGYLHPQSGWVSESR